MSLLWAILAAGAITYAIRLSFILVLGQIDIPRSLLRALRLVPVAVLSAIIFPDVLRHDGPLNLSLGNARLLAALVAAVLAWRTKNVLLTIGVGMVALWVLQVVLAGR